MDDAQLWDDMTHRGAPVAHCRRKIEHDREQLLVRRRREALRGFDRRARAR